MMFLHLDFNADKNHEIIIKKIIPAVDMLEFLNSVHLVMMLN